MEIFESPGVSPSVRFKVADLIMKTDLPQLGPYKKRSANQAFWRVASDSSRPWQERWHAIRRLLAHSGAKKPPKASPNERDRPRTGGVR